MPIKRQANQKVSSFALAVYAIVRSLKPGETKSYSEVASLAGKPRAARAVARLMATNYDVTIPCHRVIRKDGSPGGYNRGGEHKKRAILVRERKSMSYVHDV
jgi:O-6-methylguanine DNA methyltransferase